MPLDASLVGAHLGAIDVELEPRWCLAFAAGIGDVAPDRYDTTTSPVVHPLYPVSPEWELFTDIRPVPDAMTFEELITGVHRHHRVELHRPLAVGDRVQLDAHVVAVGRHDAGALQAIAFTATDDAGPVWTTRFTTLFRGVALDGEPVDLAPVLLESSGGPDATDSFAATERTLTVGPLDAQIYTACARIWNPIHTDVAFARSVGLEGPILHGTATLARAVSTVAELLDVDVRSIASIEGTFAATVPLDSSIAVRIVGTDRSFVGFEVRNEAGRRAVAGGRLGIRWSERQGTPSVVTSV